MHRGDTVLRHPQRLPVRHRRTLLVLPYREVAELEDLTPAEHAELWATVTDAVRALKAAYRPEGVNVGLNLGRPAGGSVPQHLHVHVVPRWTGDTNFMTAIGQHPDPARGAAGHGGAAAGGLARGARGATGARPDDGASA